MQIEAIRAHPGSAHVMGLWHSQKSFLIHERNNNSSSPATARNLGWFGKGIPRARTTPPSLPLGPSKALGEELSHGDTNSTSSKSSPALGMGEKEGRTGRASLGVTGQHCAAGQVSEWMRFAEHQRKGANKKTNQPTPC